MKDLMKPIRTSGAAVIALFLILVASSSLHSAYAEPAISVQLLQYKVTGRSLRDVNGEMFSGSPIIIKGRKHIASCVPDIRWRFYVSADGDWCIIKSVAVTLTITYTMPQWADYAEATSDMKDKWDAFYARLDEHEKEHGKLDIEAAWEIEREIGQAKRRSCGELKEAANEIGADILRKLTAAQDEFDARTKHGVLQDAVLHEF